MSEQEARVATLQRDVSDRCVQQEKQQQQLRRLQQEVDEKNVAVKDIEIVRHFTLRHYVIMRVVYSINLPILE